MINVCSLDFLNRDVFDTDIMTSDGKVLCSSGDKVTPEMLLKLYFRKIYINKPQVEEILDLATANVAAGVCVPRELASSPTFTESHSGGPKIASTSKFIEENSEVELDETVDSELIEFDEILTDSQLDFNEAQAKRIAELSIKLGKILNFPKNELENLEKAAYYYNSVSAQQLLKEIGISKDIMEIINSCSSDYESENFNLDSQIPYSHIISIAGYYEKMLEKCGSKQETILKMLQIGGNKFNIFILHKFLKMVRETNI